MNERLKRIESGIAYEILDDEDDSPSKIYGTLDERCAELEGK